MSKRTLEDALAHVEAIRNDGGPRLDREEDPSEFDLVLLADEVERLRLCRQCGCDHASAYELGRRDERNAQASPET